MTPFRFTPEDFAYGMERRVDARSATHASYANFLLAEMLSSAPTVYSVSTVATAWWDKQKPENATHTAKLVCIEPIVRDTAESLLREWTDYAANKGHSASEANFVKRARKLLEGE